MKKTLLLLGALFFVNGLVHSQVSQDFDQGDETVLWNNCWQTSSAGVATETWRINSGPSVRMLRTSVLNGISATLTSPFVKFNRTGVISFKHKVNNLTSTASLNLNLLDGSGNVVQNLYSTIYNSTSTINAEINIQWSGIYQLQWEWSGTGGSSQAGMDDISIHASYAADSSVENNGYCPVMSILTDSVCAASNDVDYSIYSPVESSTYKWYLSNPAIAVLDTSVTGNNSSVEIDWTDTTGTYELFVYEVNAEGCIGDTVSIMVELLAPPTVVLSADSVCEGEKPEISLSLTGSAPWEITYTDGNQIFQDTCSTTPCLLSLPPLKPGTIINVQSLRDGNTCEADVSSVPALPLVIYPKPSTGLIYH